MPHYYNKIFLLTFFLFALLFFSPHNAEALSCNQPGDTLSFGACSSFTCPINNTAGSQREERCRSADGSVISQPDYYASSDCSGNTGFCSSQCDPNNQAFCKCYSGSVTVTQACQGNYGSTGPYWCHDISCGSYCSGSPDYIEVQKQATAVDYAKPAYDPVTCKAPIPTVDLKVNNSYSVTVNSGDSITLSWTTTNTDSTKRCTGSDSFQGANPYPGDTPYPAITQTNTGTSDLVKTYSLTCYNSSNGPSNTASVTVTVKPPPALPTCTPVCPNSSDVNCGTALGSDGCSGSCSGTGTKCPTNYACTTSGCQLKCGPWSNTCGAVTRTCDDGSTQNATLGPCTQGSCNVDSASATGTSTGTASVTVNGFDRINWKLNGCFFLQYS